MTGWRIGYCGQPGASPGVHQVDHQHRFLPSTPQPVGGGGGADRFPGAVGEDAGDLPPAPGPDRGRAEPHRRLPLPPPGGAFYVWPNVTEACRMVGAQDSEEFRKRLLYEAGVAVMADIHFGTHVAGDGEHIRFSYASSFEAIDQGLERIADFMSEPAVRGRGHRCRAQRSGCPLVRARARLREWRSPLVPRHPSSASMRRSKSVPPTWPVCSTSPTGAAPSTPSWSRALGVPPPQTGPPGGRPHRHPPGG